MLSVSVCVEDDITGRRRWVELPTADLDVELADMDKDSVYVVDCDSMVPLDLGSDVSKINDVLFACRNAGIEKLDQLAALCDVCGIVYADDDDLLMILQSSEFSIYAVKGDFPAYTPEETAACYLATVQYIPFGDLKDSDLVFVEDHLSDYMDWAYVWVDYKTKGYALAEINGVVYIVQV